MAKNTNSPGDRQGEFPSPREYNEYVEGRMKGLRLAFESFVRATLPDSDRHKFIAILEDGLKRATIIFPDPNTGESGLFQRGFDEEVNEILDFLSSTKTKL